MLPGSRIPETWPCVPTRNGQPFQILVPVWRTIVAFTAISLIGEYKQRPATHQPRDDYVFDGVLGGITE